MTLTIIIVVCILLLLSYIFDLTSSKTKIPSVILLLILGFISRQATELMDIDIPDLSAFLSIFGTIGLILIVLEGAFDLELNRSKIPTIAKSVFSAFLPMVIMGITLAVFFQLFNDASFKDNLLNLIPLCVISSAIAIPSVKNLKIKNREFITYESSISDIIGVLFFTFLLTQEVINLKSFGHFGGQIVIMLIISFVATIILVLLLGKIDNHIKFAPIIILIILIFALSEVFHLPALIFIFIFGLFLGNIDKLQRIKLIQKANPNKLFSEVQKFGELVNEGSFLIRSMFFLIFGFLIEPSELFNLETLAFAVLIVVLIFVLRWIFLKITKMPIDPLLFVAPRGLITILLFLSIPTTLAIDQVNKSLVIQVIVLTAIVLMFGLMTSKSKKEIEATESSDEDSDITKENTEEKTSHETEIATSSEFVDDE